MHCRNNHGYLRLSAGILVQGVFCLSDSSSQLAFMVYFLQVESRQEKLLEWGTLSLGVATRGSNSCVIAKVHIRLTLC